MHEQKPLRLSAEQRRQDIVKNATQLFAIKGFRGTTTKEIADACGISEATIFRHFSTKEELYDAIIRLHTEHASHEELESVWIEGGDDQTVLRAFARRFLSTHMQDPHFWRLLLYSGLEEHGLAGRFFEHYVSEGRTRAIAYVRRRQREGAFRSEIDPAFAISAFVGMLVNYVTSVQVFKRDDFWQGTVRETADAAADLFLHGIRVVPCDD